MEIVKGNIVNIFDDEIFFGEVVIHEGRIFSIKNLGSINQEEPYVMPGFVDAHVHIESSMLCPSEFGRKALVHGTLGSVSDPHEIANVLGIEGVEYMIKDARNTPFKVTFGAPSCVPATNFETAGSIIDADQIAYLLEKPEIGYLAEMMNYPGVIYNDEQVMLKLKHAKACGKPIDGHAPGVMGEDAVKYFSEGISTDHECFMYDEALEKLKLGVKILIREGSAAKNFDTLIPLAKEWSHQMMFCSDDKHPDDLLKGHINLLVKRAIDFGIEPFDAFRMASLNPVKHYQLDIGLLREGDHADFLLVDNLQNLKIIETYVDGNLVAKNGESLRPYQQPAIINNFDTVDVLPEQLKVYASDSNQNLNVIQVIDGQLITQQFATSPVLQGNEILTDTANDILKIVVYNRYKKAEPAIGFINGFGLQKGAIASSVAHDSHNIIAVGVDDDAISDAINLVIREKGGISVVSDNTMGVLGLPIAGLMSPKTTEEVAADYEQIDQYCKTELSCVLKSPFMSLSFMALLVIPNLKLSDKGLFDGKNFNFVDILI